MPATTAIEAQLDNQRPDLEALFTQLNRELFDHQIPVIPVAWSKRMTRAAGLFWWKQHLDGKKPEFEYGIRLSLPLLQQRPHADLLATLAHEMIHAWVSLYLEDLRHGHGTLFQTKMAEVNRIQSEFEVTQHHSFTEEVQRHTKYRWDCSQCGAIYRRQRNSIDVKRHRCGKCRGQLKPVKSINS
ncbi:MAG: SprT family zinc-dependent metalloprotease [Synechococcus sp.]